MYSMSCIQLSACTSLATLNLANNRISTVSTDDGADHINFFLEAVPQIRCLSMQGNPLEIRDSSILREALTQLAFLNDFPIRRSISSDSDLIEESRGHALTERRRQALDRISRQVPSTFDIREIENQCHDDRSIGGPTTARSEGWKNCI